VSKPFDRSINKPHPYIRHGFVRKGAKKKTKQDKIRRAKAENDER